MHKRIAVVLTIASASMLAACGGGGDTETTTPTTAPPAATTAAPSATQTSGESRIAMEDNRFDPNSLTVASGTEVELDNEGQAPHTFTIDGEDIDVEVDPGNDGSVTLDLDPGTYQFYCKFHKGLGMTGSLTVS